MPPCLTPRTRPDDPAFPGNTSFGLTTREYFAAKIMAGFAASDTESLPGAGDGIDLEGTAHLAVEWADALIDALNESR